MSERITLTVPERLKKELEDMAEASGNSQSAIVRAALHDYLYIRRFRALRNRLTAQAASQEIYTDEDVFERIS